MHREKGLRAVARHHRTAAWAVALLVTLTGLVTFAAPSNGSMAIAPGLAPLAAPPFPTPIRHVLFVMLENQEAKDVLANGSYERSLARSYAYADQFYSPMHYSLPNYLAATSGYTSNLFAPLKQSNVGSLSQAIGRTWKDYQESMPGTCDLSGPLSGNYSGNMSPAYDPYHNPFALYKPFVNNSAQCHQHMVNFTQWNADVAANTVPNYGLIVPNTSNDGHDLGIASAELWLSNWLPPLLNDTFFRTTALFLVYDEGTTNLGANGTVGGGRIYATLVSPYAHRGLWSETNYTTYSLLTTTEWLLGLGSTHTHDDWSKNPPLREMFNFPVAVSGTVVDGSGTPIPGIAVSDHLGDSAHSNASGGFTLSLSSGNYTLYVSPKSGWVGHLAVTVAGNPITGLVLPLKIAP